MTQTQQLASGPRRRFGRLHWAWVVAAVSFLVLISTSGFRSLPSVVMAPMHEDMHWSYGTISLAISVNLVLVGLAAPYAAALMERLGIRLVLATALVLIAVGTGLPVVTSEPWQLVLLWGGLVGLGCGAISLAFVATLTNRWFVKYRGLVTGVLTAASTAGQLVFLPVLGWLSQHSGWRTVSVVVAVAAVISVPFIITLLRERPRDMGLAPLGAEPGPDGEPVVEEEEPAPRGAFRVLRDAVRTRVFWLLAGSFAICGVTTSGVMQTHFIPAAEDHGMTGTTAAGLLAVAGVFDIAGTTVSGWLTDRYDSRFLLATYYTLRGLSLILLPLLFAATPTPSMIAFAVFYGLDWIATVPPTIRLCQQYFGSSAGVVFGWMWTAHQIGGAIAAEAGGMVRDHTGSYTIVWVAAGATCLFAAVLSMLPPVKSRRGPALPVVAEAS
ncbi:putative MFS family arabinose efflux permease [Amycolatopsis bartoniae]|uniref:MFS transporter n=1 Tax=Amycolatopsis bartoniae TaxID=941986 RepID=A0A8H9M718_9PSEU|nr:MFS transporter [Amycolatopsis bartoniae]MBB2938530.1 putative MFS family arabinose efflux permease [Amycolatopsis bartoniae]TVT10329.1 MFS transporter [Amycolatopsis bartoniae]GHF70344.1 MFS transporter [Amycolatopsis bartoniae]